MSTTTLDRTETPASTPDKKKTKTPVKISRFSLWKERLTRGSEERTEARGWFSVMSWTVLLRLIVLTADYLLAVVTAMVIIPQTALWIHQQSGIGDPGLLSDASIAMWLLPLASLVAVIVVAELVVMRAMWRWATRRIERFKGIDEQVEQIPAARAALGRANKKNTKKRSK